TARAAPGAGELQPAPLRRAEAGSAPRRIAPGWRHLGPPARPAGPCCPVCEVTSESRRPPAEQRLRFGQVAQGAAPLGVRPVARVVLGQDGASEGQGGGVVPVQADGGFSLRCLVPPCSEGVAETNPQWNWFLPRRRRVSTGSRPSGRRGGGRPGPRQG